MGTSGSVVGSKSGASRELTKLKPTNEHTRIHNIVAQAADYARLHMSSHPFTIFSVGLVVFGSDFRLAIFDCGIMFSLIKDIWTESD